MKWTALLSRVFPGLTLASVCAFAAAPGTPQGYITGKAFNNLSGTALAGVTNAAKFPNNPDALTILPYFEWNADQVNDINIQPPRFGDNYGAQIVGYFYPPTTGAYIFRIASDDNGVLYLSTNSSATNKRLIARETSNSGIREYFTSGASTVADKDSSTFTATEWPDKDPNTGGAAINLEANQPYYIEAIVKEGGGGDHLSVSVQDPNGAIDPSFPIPGAFLSSDRTAGPALITRQPQNITVPERGSGFFNFMVDGTPPYAIQWRRDGNDILDATNLTYTVSNVTVADNNAKFVVVITGGEGAATSQEVTLTVAPDVVAPTLVAVKGGVSRTEVTLSFSEPLDPTSATTASNYQISSAAGPLNVTGATLSANGTEVTLTTDAQTLGTKYTIIVNGVKDTAAAPNTIAANTKTIFFPFGRVVEQNGFVVFETENYDRNLDGLWVRDTTRGSPSGGASMVNPNGAGGSESGTQMEYDVEFKQTATYKVWYRASGDNGNDDSIWFHLDGVKPLERETGNQASMSGFSGALDFVWRSDAQDAPDPFTVDITEGVHIVGIARREDGSFIDKMIITTDMAYTPTGFGPPETREGAPGLPTIALTAPTAGQTFAVGANAPFTVNAAGSSGLNITKVQYTANGNAIGESTTAPFSFTWSNLVAGVYGIRATAIDELGQTVTSDSVAIKVGTPPPQALLVVGTVSSPTLNPSDAAVKARLETNGWQVTVVQAPASTTADADGKQLVVVSATINSGDVGTKFRNSAVPVVSFEQAVQDDFLMTGNTDTVDRGTVTNQTSINIVKADHPLAGGLTAGAHTVTTSGLDMGFGVPNTNAVVIATLADDPGKAVIYGYDTGAKLIDNTTLAPARRVMMFPANDSFAAFTADALKLFDAAVEWASGIAPKPPKTSANIAWVSFHPSDAQASANAQAVGFTNGAPDQKYTQLLRANGHQVTRFITSGAPDTNVLNTFDLVIISRSVPSGDYQDPPETLAWNGITAPTMILSGYIVRQNRLGLMTGNNIPDTVNPITLTATDTNHPIFKDVQFDANNTMVNAFADPVTFNGTLQRGISVVTDPVAGAGTVLATVGTAGDLAFGGAVIAEWKAGDIMANTGANPLGGDRLIFLTGSREQATGLSAEGAGIYDLTADGAKLFLNAVNYMAGVQPSAEPPAISIARTGDAISISFTGVLEAADSIDGQWSEVTGATNLYTVPTAGVMKFYRTKR